MIHTLLIMTLLIFSMLFCVTLVYHNHLAKTMEFNQATKRGSRMEMVR